MQKMVSWWWCTDIYFNRRADSLGSGAGLERRYKRYGGESGADSPDHDCRAGEKAASARIDGVVTHGLKRLLLLDRSVVPDKTTAPSKTQLNPRRGTGSLGTNISDAKATHNGGEYSIKHSCDSPKKTSVRPELPIDRRRLVVAPRTGRGR